MLKKDRARRKKRNRDKLGGTPERPRVSVFKSNKFVYAQAIDDLSGKTLVSVTSVKSKASEAGENLASLLTKKKIKAATFDRSGYRYHGQVKALAEGLRKGGINV